MRLNNTDQRGSRPALHGYRVCNGPFQQGTQGEHTLRKGGQCGLIDSKGNLVVAAQSLLEDHTAVDEYLAAINPCPHPPIQTTSAALCHAKRHVADMDGHSTRWQRQRITRVNNTWQITFTEQHRKDGPFTLILNAESAELSGYH